MKGCALVVRMLRMSIAQACTWGVPLSRKLTTANWPVSSSLHRSVSGFWLLQWRPRPWSCFNFLYLHWGSGKMSGPSRNDMRREQHARVCCFCLQSTQAGVGEVQELAAADLGCPLIGLLLYRAPLLLRYLSPCLEVPLEKNSPWRGVLGDGGCELLRSWSLAVSSLSRSKWTRTLSDAHAVEVHMGGAPGAASSSPTLLG